MTTLNVWPQIGASVPVPNEDSPALTTAGANVTLTEYIQRMIFSGLLLTHDPLDAGDEPPALALTDPSAGFDLVLCTDLDDLIGDTDNPIVYATGYASNGDGGEGLFRWSAAATDTANNGTIFGSLATGRWFRQCS